MELKIWTISGDSLKASYDCPCGCHPEVSYHRGGPTQKEGCCCGNQFAVGIAAREAVEWREGFAHEVQTFTAPWQERLEAAWLVGPSSHPANGPES